MRVFDNGEFAKKENENIIMLEYSLKFNKIPYAQFSLKIFEEKKSFNI